jgi:orotate phosphoribosyltransferase
MHSDRVKQILESVGAIQHGHFLLSSGRHSETYVQCALVLSQPGHAETLGRALADRFRDLPIDLVVSLAIGAIVLGHEVGRALGVRALWVERDAEGRFALRREFGLVPGERALVIEDVWTTGQSTREAISVIENSGGEVAAVGALVDRSGGRLQWPVPAQALYEMAIPSYPPGECPLCRAGSVAVRPGSRFKQAAP